MPPSPALRCSPGREPRANQHRRGRSFESGMIVREKDEDLALFNEMQTREKEDFLLQSDDLEDTFSTKLRQFSDFKLGITIPTRGESSDLLNAEEEKNDYEWLLTPPDTPLFPSLDDEPPPVNAAQRGRPRSQPISISRSSTMEKSYRSSRGSASPNRLSTSPHSGNSTFQSRGRPSSVRNSSPTPSLHPASPSRPATPSRSATSSRPATPSRSATSSRPATPSRRPSTPPSKSPTPAPRSSTPTPRRMSTGSSSTVAPLGRRGSSPVTTSRGNSASPKIRAWQTNMTGFSSDAPPNLRTSLADRPATYVRGSSPASRSGRGSSPASGYRRQSMSPTASRSVSSSQSHDRDPFSSHSKGSIASYGDDDLDSLQSLPVGSLDRSTPRRVAAFSNNRAVAFSKKSAKLVSPSSAPKRSFDSAIRQMDHRKTPQNMFRPLLSSVPSSTFYVGKSSSPHRPLISRNSSVTTSSNASSDLGTSVAPDTEGSDHNQDDMASESEKVPYSDGHEEVFAFDKMDVVNEDSGHDIHDGSHDIHDGEFTRSTTVECVAADSADSGHPNIVMEVGPTSEDCHVNGDFSEIDSLEDMALCLKCGCRYYVSDEVGRKIRLCPECSRKDTLLSVLIPERTVVPENSPLLSVKNMEEKPLDALETMIVVPGSPQVTDLENSKCSHGEENVDQSQTFYKEQIHNGLEENSLARPLVEGGEDELSEQQEVLSLTLGGGPPNGDTGGLKSYHSNNYPNMRVDISEGTGISILLKRSSSRKGAAVQGRNFTATTIPYQDLSYARDSSSSMRSSIGHGSFSASSSVDFSPARQTEARVQRQLSGKKLEMENHRHDTNMKPQGIGLSDMGNHRHDTNMKHQSIGSSSYGLPNYSHHALGRSSDTIDDDFEITVGNGEYDVAEGTYTASEEHLPTSDCREADVTTTTSTRTTVVEEDKEIDARSTRVDASTLELLSHAASPPLQNNTVAMFPNSENCASNEYSEDLKNNARSATDVEVSATALESSLNEENIIRNSSVNGVDVEEITNHSFFITVSEIETEKGHQSTSGSMSDDASLESKSTMEDFQEPSPNPSDSVLTSSVPETNTSNRAHGILEEESTVIVERQGRSKARSLTLEEATDTILLCSSIVHDLAYQAATIAIEKERSVPLEGSHPTVTILGKSNLERKEPRGRTVGRRSVKSQKGRQKRLETDAGPPASKTENDENENENVDESLQQRPVGLPPNKVDGMKAPKLESKCNCTIM